MHCCMYNITQATKAAPGNELGIFEDLGDYYAQEVRAPIDYLHAPLTSKQDLDLFFASLASNIPVGTHPILHGVDGGTAPTSVATAGPESDLDFQISYVCARSWVSLPISLTNSPSTAYHLPAEFHLVPDR